MVGGAWLVVVVVVVVVVSTPAQLCFSSGTHIYGGGSIYAMEQTLRWSLALKRHIPRAASHASATVDARQLGASRPQQRAHGSNKCLCPWPANASVSVPDSHTSTDSCDQRTATSAFVPLSGHGGSGVHTSKPHLEACVGLGPGAGHPIQGWGRLPPPAFGQHTGQGKAAMICS